MTEVAKINRALLADRWSAPRSPADFTVGAKFLLAILLSALIGAGVAVVIGHTNSGDDLALWSGVEARLQYDDDYLDGYAKHVLGRRCIAEKACSLSQSEEDRGNKAPPLQVTEIPLHCTQVGGSSALDRREVVTWVLAMQRDPDPGFGC